MGKTWSGCASDLKVDPKDTESKERAKEVLGFCPLQQGRMALVRNREEKDYRRSRWRKTSSISAMLGQMFK